MCPHSPRQRPVNNYGERLRQQTVYIGNFPFLFYKPQTPSFLPQSKWLLFWVKLFRMYLVQPLIILVFSRFRGVQNVPQRIFALVPFFPYNFDFTMTELRKALLQAHNTSPGPDRITYTMLRHLNPDSLTNILCLYIRVSPLGGPTFFR
ncbi:UNVERIFIED_CONTAM: hypothetical protein NCL1_13288 [Trichonephila clavipes]